MAQQTKVLLVSGNENHKWHNWEQTTPFIKAALEEDSSISVTVSLSIESLADEELFTYDALALNYCNWHEPAGLSERAKANLIRFAEEGKGLVIVHFANGAFHYSLPEAEASDWPEYRSIVPRVWNHHGESSHDKYGEFTVHMTGEAHPITQGISSFAITDELYFKQEGVVPIQVLYEAESNRTNRREPLGWLAQYRNSRVYQTLLGHDEKAYEVPQVREMLRRGVLWTVHRL
ncbi:ThuA domain-containing protein [Paenibacillus thalictri]|nr:ThuA domain-containing protein [Paenibacillus thalictri]